jgi:hypothetical protein
MKFISPFTTETEAERFLTRSAGYLLLFNRHKQQKSFARPLDRAEYPRFHIYPIEKNGSYIFSLHLDQKRISYANAHAHNAEYDGDNVSAERDRLQALWSAKKEDKKESASSPEKKRTLIRRIIDLFS